MKTISTLLLILFSGVAITQPEITQANLPIIGDHVIISICSGQVEPGDAGADITWDMSGLQEQEEQYFDYIAASEGPHADSFPNANICGVSWLDDYSFYGHSPNSLTAEGYVVTYNNSDTTLMVFDDHEQIVGLPYTYNDTFTDEFDGTSYIDGIGTFPFDGTIDFEADGYGTLTLPNGTYNNVVRYHFTREQTNYFNGFPAGTQTKEQWAWVSSDYRFWLLLMETIFDGVSTSSLIWYDKNPYPATTGISPIQFNSGNIYPNPLKTGQQLHIRWNETEESTISVIRSDGRLVFKYKELLQQGSNSIDIPIESEGLYIIQVQTSTQLVSGKILLQN